MLDDGTTQLTQYSYDTANFFKVTGVIDPVGRKTSFVYANGIDLSAISQTTAYGVQTTIAQFTYNSQHRPLVYTNAAGQTTINTYNAAGQLTSVTNPLNQTTSYQYDSKGRLSTITNANNVIVTTYTYDAYDRIATTTDSEGWSVSYDYDAADRLTKATYPDGTTESYIYTRLDLASYKDRLGRVWMYTYDANRRLTTVRDPLGNQMLFGYNETGQQASLTDAKGNTTSWTYDVQGRLTSKGYANGSTVTYAYEAMTSRLKSVTDALGQTRQYAYVKDKRLAGIIYLNAANPTPNVSLSYDLFFPRLVSMTDGNGTTQYSYVPVGSPGALKPQQQTSPMPSSAISYSYDPLGRVISRTVSGSGTESFQYDAIGRLIGRTNDLGSFTLSYLGQTEQIAQRQLANATLSTTWSYLPNSDDRRLSGVSNIGLSLGQFSNYQFTTTPEGFITRITEASDTPITYPSPLRQIAGFNSLNQVTSLSGQSSMSYDPNGNLLSDGQRSYTWDAENRLIRITWPAQPGKQTTFAYDGFGRRIAISSSPSGGGSTTTTSYIWCQVRLCQARNASNAVTRAYYLEGELVPGTPAQLYYYGPDQLGSVRRAFASAGGAPAYRYDPYGNALQGTSPVTDFGYAGMFYHADSGLYFTRYRAYDPAAGRWLSRDPIGESSDPAANLYAYVAGNPITRIDPSGTSDFDIFMLDAFRMMGGALVRKLLPQPGTGVCRPRPDWTPPVRTPPVMESAGGGKEFDPDQGALVDLAKQGKRGGFTPEEVGTLQDWGKEVDKPVRGPETHPGRGHGSKEHIHVGPIDHIPVKRP